MSRNRFYLLGEKLIPWQLDADLALPWPVGPDCRYFGGVLQALDGASPDLGLRFVVTTRIDGPLPIRGDDVVVVCIRDELCRIPTYAHEVRLVAKTYGVHRTPNVMSGGSGLLALGATLTQEAIVQGRRAPSILASRFRTMRSGRRARVVDVPLGTYLLEDVPFVPFDQRRYAVSYAGSRHDRREESRRRVPTQKMRSRRQLEQTVRALQVERADIALGLHIIESARDAPSHSTVYSQMLIDSQIALCPRGGSLETYRFFEALRCGCVPISERLPNREFYTGAPAVRVERWTELPLVLDRLLADPEQLRAMHTAAIGWWAQHCSPAAVAGRLIDAINAESYLESLD